MHFKDPLNITCTTCGSKAMQRVADLLGLRAKCPGCGSTLTDIGRKMRGLSDDWSRLVTLIELIMDVERALGQTITDAETENVITLGDLAHVVERKLPPHADAAAESLQLVESAVRKLPHFKSAEILLDTPLIDAVYPDRWK